MKRLTTFIILITILLFNQDGAKYISPVTLSCQESCNKKETTTKLKSRFPSQSIDYIINILKLLIDQVKNLRSRILFIITLNRIKVCFSAGVETRYH